MEQTRRMMQAESARENEEVNSAVKSAVRAMDRLDQVNPIQRTKQEMLRDYEVAFSFLHSGCTIRIGCKHIAFTTIKEAMTAFNEYVNDPETAREKWFKKFNEE